MFKTFLRKQVLYLKKKKKDMAVSVNPVSDIVKRERGKGKNSKHKPVRLSVINMETAEE